MRVALHDQGIDVARHRLGDRFLLVLALALLGYALGGRGFAYAGIPPIFVGEAVLIFGLIAFALTRGWPSVMRLPQVVALLPLVVWGIVRLIPGIGQWGIVALRDAVIWGYAAFALVLATLIIADPNRLPRLIVYYRRFTKIFLIL